MIWIRVVGWGLALLIFASTEVRAADPRQVLMLNPFDHAFSPWSDVAASFRAELIRRSPEPIDVYEVSISHDTKTPGPFIEYLHALLSKRKLDLIVPIGGQAAQFVGRNRSELFPSTPVLIAGSEQRLVPRDTVGANAMAVALSLDHSILIENILRLLPETKNIAVIFGNSPVEKYWRSELRKEFQRLEDRVSFTWLNDLSFGELLKQVANLPPQSAIYYNVFSEDANGVPYAQDRALMALHAVATAPLFGLGDYELGRGIVGGPLLPTQALGEQAAMVAIRILGGEQPGEIKFPPLGFGAPVYDWRELHRWGIGEDRLPPGSNVRFREPTVLQEYRWQIMGVAAALLGNHC